MFISKSILKYLFRRALSLYVFGLLLCHFNHTLAQEEFDTDETTIVEEAEETIDGASEISDVSSDSIQSMKLRPFEAEAQYLHDVETYMKQFGVTKSESFNNLTSSWNGISADNKKQVLHITRALADKRAPFYPVIDDFLYCVYAISQNKLPSEKGMEFFQTADITASIYPLKIAHNLIATTRSLLETQAVFNGSKNQVSLSNVSISFGHTLDSEIADETALLNFDNSAISNDEESGESWYDHLEEESVTEENEEDEFLSDEDLEDEYVEESNDDDSGWGDDSWEEDSSDDDSGWGDDSWEEESSDDEGWGDDDWTDEDAALLDDTEFNISMESTGGMEMESDAVISTGGNEIPEVLGPFITIESTDINIKTPYDTVSIKGASGTFIAKSLIFIGEGGEFKWPQVDATVKFSSFFFPVRKPVIHASDAIISYPSKFSTEEEGEFTFISKRKKAGQLGNYPLFQSYHNSITLDDLPEGITYMGGFTMRGKKTSSESYNGGWSYLTITRDGNTKVTTKSRNNYLFQDSIIRNPRANIALYNGLGDSISHPGSRFIYSINDASIKVQKDKGRFKRARFMNSALEVEMEVEKIDWSLDEDTLDIYMVQAKDIILATIESIDYFDVNRYNWNRKLYPFHPLKLVVGYAKSIKNNVFYVYDLANDPIIQKAGKLDIALIKGAVQELAYSGFVEYDPSIGKVTVNRSAFFYVYGNERFNRYNRKIDYDNIHIRSLASDSIQYNMRMNFQEKIMEVNGVSSFLISDSLKVLVNPENKRVYLKEDRSFDFAGELRAGQFVFRADSFNFNYDEFKVDLAGIRNFTLLVPDSITGEPVEMDNTMSSTTGTLYVGLPKNKSGLINTPNFPKFDAGSGATINFSGDEILEGAYDERVSFDMPPFEIDSINQSDLSDMRFTGTFKTSGMFPDFEEKIRIMPDKSFGFIKDLPEEGYPLFEGKARYYNQLKLDNSGIRGNGRIQYLSGNFNSNDFVFFSDSVRTTGTNGKIDKGTHEGTSFPCVNLPKYRMRWVIDSDKMLLSTFDSSFNIYDKETQFNGILAYSADSLAGTGSFRSEKSLTTSKRFLFKENDFVSRNSTFKLELDNPEKPALIGKDVKVEFDKTGREALVSNEQIGTQSMILPFSKYKTGLDEGYWDIEGNRLDLRMRKGSNITKALFTPLGYGNNGVSFEATNATCDLTTYQLDIEGIDEIKVANVLVIPDEGHATVLENGDVDTLRNAKLILNAETQYHTLTNAIIKIKNKDYFTGEGTYNYKNLLGTEYPIDFQFNVQKRDTEGKKKDIQNFASGFQTIGWGEVPEEQNLIVFPGLTFKGGIYMVDNERQLEFDGLASLDIEREDNPWFKFNIITDSTSKGEVEIDETVVVEGTNNRVYTGLYIDKDERSMFGSFINYKPGYEKSNPIFESKGKLSFDEASGAYMLRPIILANQNSKSGNKMLYWHSKSELEYEGVFTFIENGNDFELTASGAGNGSMDLGDFDINSLLVIKPLASASTFAEVANDFLADSANTTPDVSEINQFETKLAKLLSGKQWEQYQGDANANKYSLARDFSSGIVLSDVELKWSDETKSFYSKGSIGLGSIYKDDIRRKVSGYIEIPKKDPIDESPINNNFTMFIFNDDVSRWLYISYDGKRVKALASSSAFNQIVGGKKKEKNLQSVDLINVKDFTNNFRLNYLNTEEPLDIKATESAVSISGFDDFSNDFPEEFLEDEAFSEDEVLDESEFEEAEEGKKKKKKKKKADKDEDDPFGEDELPEEESEEDGDDW